MPRPSKDSSTTTKGRRKAWAEDMDEHLENVFEMLREPSYLFGERGCGPFRGPGKKPRRELRQAPNGLAGLARGRGEAQS